MLKKVLTGAVLGASMVGVMAANAAVPGVYVTGQLGAVNTHMKAKTEGHGPTTPPDQPLGSNLNNNGLAGRLAVGYQFNQNWAVELGYLQLKNGKYVEVQPKDKITTTLKQNAIDIAAKGILPLSDRFDVYGKLGLAYVTSDIAYTDKYAEGHKYNDVYSIAKHKWAPEAAVGVSYDLTSNVSIDTSWTHIQPVGSHRPGNIDFVAVGVGYKFG
jgi:OOP family OmpA-OmpF porin